MEATKLRRVFTYSGIELPDPDPSISPEKAIEAFVAIYPELNNCSVEEPQIQGDKLVYKVLRAVGRKGNDDDSQETDETERTDKLSRTLVISQVERFFSSSEPLASIDRKLANEKIIDLPPVTIL